MGPAVALAVQVQPVAADVVGLPGGCVGVLVADQGDVLVRRADRSEREYGDDGGEHPAPDTSDGPSHPEEHPACEREHDRRPHPAEPGHRVVPGRVLQERDAADAHRCGGNGRPALGTVRVVHGQHGDERPTEREGQQDRAGDDALAAAGEHDQGEGRGRSPGRRRWSRQRCVPPVRSVAAWSGRQVGTRWPVGWVSTLMSVSLSQSVVHCTRAWSRTGLLTPVRWPGSASWWLVEVEPGELAA